MRTRDERIRARAKKYGRYPVTLLFVILFAMLAVTLWWSTPPITGRMDRSASSAPNSWKLGYLTGGSLKGVTARLEPFQDLLFVAGPAVMAADSRVNGRPEPAPRTFFPIWDLGITPAEAALYYPHIPEDQLAGYGRTAYFVDYGEARIWFLNAERLALEPDFQLQWLKRSAASNPQLHRMVFLNKEPMQPEFWNGLAESGAELVLVGARLFAPETAVTSRPQAGYRSSAHPGWAEWTVTGGPAALVTVEGRGSRLEAAAAAGSAGRTADRLVLDAAALRRTAAVQERAPLSIGATWSYRAGGSDLRAVIPQGLDLTGEQPLVSQVKLPREDWRSPAFDDAGWSRSVAPFGRSLDNLRKRSIATWLPAEVGSPAYYFRKTFVIEDNPEEIKEWLLHVAFEDGFIAYLNGIEIARDSLPEGLIDYRSLAEPHTGGLFELFPLVNQSSVVVKGVNTLAIEIHGSHPQTPELWFDASLSYRK